MEHDELRKPKAFAPTGGMHYTLPQQVRLFDAVASRAFDEFIDFLLTNKDECIANARERLYEGHVEYDDEMFHWTVDYLEDEAMDEGSDGTNYFVAKMLVSGRENIPGA